MKKTLITLILAVVVFNLFALDMINPASEMSGDYLRFATYNQKSFMEFDDGFNNISLSISKPYIWRNFALSGDLHLLGDGIYKRFNWNISPGITLYQRLTLAISLGGISTSLDEGDLIFGEEETLGGLSVTKPNFGMSVKTKMWEDKIEFSAFSSNLNRPEMNFLDKTEKLDMLLQTNLNWNISPKYQVGLSFKNESSESYLGLNFSVKFPYDNITNRIEFQQERVSYKPSIELFNYWYFGLGYDLYHDSNLGYQNIEVDLAYEYTGKQTPVIQVEPVDTENKETVIDFTLTGADRFSKIQLSCNNYIVMDERDVWNAEGKTFSVPVRLIDLDNKLLIVVKSSTAVETRYEQNIYFKPAAIEVIALATTPEIVTAESTEAVVDTSLTSVEKPNVEEKNPDGIFKPRPKYQSSEAPEDYVESHLVIVNMPENYEVPLDHPYLYKVKKGDNLWDISKKKNVYGNPLKWINLYTKNGIATPDPNHLYPGQILYIDNGSESQRTIFYEIQQGDTCYNIARKLEPQADRHLLIVSNIEKILNPHMIMPGKKIMIKIYQVER